MERVIRFGKRGKLNPRYIGPFKILAKVGAIAYRLELPERLIRVYSTFHVSNPKKCLSDKPLAIPLNEIQIDDKLNFIEEPIEIIDLEVKHLKQSHIPIVNVYWNSRSRLELFDIVIHFVEYLAHYLLNQVFLRGDEISAKKKTRVNFLTYPLDGTSTLRPADVLIFGWVGGKHVCAHLTMVSPLVDLSSMGFTVGHATLKAVSCKVTKHDKTIENQHVFIPFAFDTFGFLAPETVELNGVQRVMHSNVMTHRSTNLAFAGGLRCFFVSVGISGNTNTSLIKIEGLLAAIKKNADRPFLNVTVVDELRWFIMKDMYLRCCIYTLTYNGNS
nr:auxilin-like protein [Tanacetum cinerariifolium]